ncbi:MAG TPA: hypothetical protein PKA05_17425 [Roseiflexaceae bacterium]|nr:hypothetical protein [Roseiflexaceae bacterium]HMP42163.1 hypothetical protein [Roseiflexaceae bacterium]
MEQSRSDTGGYYLVRVRGELGPLLEGWFGDLVVEICAPGELLIHGRLADQAALHGLFARLHFLRLPLLEVRYLPPGSEPPENPTTIMVP